MNRSSTDSGTVSADSFRPVSFSGSFTFENAAAIRAELLKVTTESSSIELDLSRVSEIDLTGLQIICSLHRTAQAQGLIIRLLAPIPENIGDFAREAGFPRHTACLKGLSNLCVWDEDHGAN